MALKRTTATHEKKPTSRWSRCEWHYARLCPFKKHQCQTCNRWSHKEKDYRGDAERWTQGIIVRRAGRVVYQVNVGSSIWVRHANQLRASYLPATVTLDPVLPLEILLGTFELSQKAKSPEPMNEPAISKSCAPRRWTDRIRRPVRPMQLNPQQQSYDQALQRGEDITISTTEAVEMGKVQLNTVSHYTTVSGSNRRGELDKSLL
ncbi:hypothetical protein CLF_109028 [Clonorchis sinensis]|uniref:Gap-Pol polyprotein n=1 Tax=Clonorchis sinensis TaxID=79923 RepID=G7YIU4_CLOSI|nr:hypothetical protein CLF_109028 [Clonorchis sinensis]